ncbi:hypothetical protein JTB14_004223 [Gonioctena quinquepunctata]|nr:hypothetical protein JTB14_004223 [Gonioctena quinquepunctata]
MTFLIGQLKILQNRFRNFGKESSETKTAEEEMKALRLLILEHKRIIMYVENLDDCMKFPLLLEFTINSIQITSLLFQLLTLDVDVILVFRVTYSTLMIIQIFLLAWHANEIKEQSVHISQAIYENNWYNVDLKLRRILHIVMMRAQRPLTLSIGPFFSLTNDTAVMSMKTAYSYFTIMNKK